VTTFADALLAVARISESAIPHPLATFFLLWLISPASSATDLSTGTMKVLVATKSRSSGNDAHFSLRYFSRSSARVSAEVAAAPPSM
jgi:hypothetical protein